MFFFNRREKPIKRQIRQFTEAKVCTKGWPVAMTHQEHLTEFMQVAKVESIFDVRPEHVYWYKTWLIDRYESQYTVTRSMTSVNALLSFYKRYDILHDMHITRRPPNLEMIEVVKKYRAKKVPFRDIKAILEAKSKDGKRFDLKTLWFWAHYKTKKLSTVCTTT